MTDVVPRTADIRGRVVTRRALSLFVGLILLASSAVDVTGHATQNYHYYGNCKTVDWLDTGEHGLDWIRNTYTFTAVKVQIVAQRLDPCTAGTGNQYQVSKSLQLASLQGNGANGVYNLVQIGIGKVANDPGYYQQCSDGSGTMTNDQTTFIWTGPDVTNGTFCKATWADFSPANPVADVVYTFSIEAVVVGGANKWKFSIKRDSDGVTKTGYATRTATTGISGNSGAWWGCEVGNTANQLGVPNYTDPIWMRSPAYKKTGSTSWWYTENSSMIWEPWLGGVKEFPKRWYYNVAVDQSVLGEQVDCHTESHNTN